MGWISFVFSIISMTFIDVIVVNEQYRVETIKLAMVKDEEYILNNQCLWYSVHRRDWGKIDRTIKKKQTDDVEEQAVPQRIDHGHDEEESSSSSFDGGDDDFSNLSILNNVDSQCINDRASRHSVLAMANGGVFSQNKCCSKPFSCLQ